MSPPKRISVAHLSITPLLKKLVGHHAVDPKEIKAALLLLDNGNISDTQVSLLLGLLTLRQYELSVQECNRFLHFLEEDQPSTQAAGKQSIVTTIRLFLNGGEIPPDEIADVITLALEDRLSAVHCSLLLGFMAYTGLDKDPEVLSKAAGRMRAAANRADHEALRKAIQNANRSRGLYQGGLCDIVGTGGDGHSTYNVSTTASIIASSYLMLSKHGNRASSSTSGSADLLQAVWPKGPDIEAVTSHNLPAIYERSSYAFLFAPRFHPGMKHVAALRKELGIRTIFNVLGPLVNPVEDLIETRIVGVAEKRMGPVFAEALRLTGAKKAMVVCGAENLDEISCAGRTYCWRLYDEDNTVRIDEFQLEPQDFGLPSHSLTEVAGGRSPQENASILVDMLENRLDKDDPVLHFVLINAAALFAIAGLCERNPASTEREPEMIVERGPGGQRWKEGIRLARKALKEGKALESLQNYIAATRSCND